jgi:hypothetical protein
MGGLCSELPFLKWLFLSRRILNSFLFRQHGVWSGGKMTVMDWGGGPVNQLWDSIDNTVADVSSKQYCQAGCWWLTTVILLLGVRDQKDYNWRPTWANSSWDPILKNPIPKKGWLKV